MYSLTKILLTLLATSALTFVSLDAWSKNRIKQIQQKHRSTTVIGFRLGRESTLNATNTGSSKVFSTNKALYAKKTFTSHLQAEVGVKYGLSDNSPASYKFFRATPQYSISLPASIQYQFFPEHYKLRPYCGIGLQCNILNNTGNPPVDNEISQNRTKYISLLFTQGVTYEINTKINVEQSFHFIPGQNKTIGINVGIGFKLP